MSAIREIALAKAIGGSGGGSSVTVEELTVNQNGTTTAPEGKAYNPVIANVQPPLQEKTVNANGDVTPDTGYYGLSKVVVDVPPSGGGEGEVTPDYAGLSYAYVALNGQFYHAKQQTYYMTLFPIEKGHKYACYLSTALSNRLRIHQYYDKEIADFYNYLTAPYGGSDSTEAIYTCDINETGGTELVDNDIQERFIFTAVKNGMLVVLSSNLSAVVPALLYDIGISSSEKIVDWRYSPDEDIVWAIQAAHAGTINLQRDFTWQVGQKRDIEISAYTDGVYTHDATNCGIVISSFDNYNGCGCVMQFDFIKVLDKAMRMNSTATNVGGYGASEMKTTFLPALVSNGIPSWLRNLLIEFDVLVSAGGQSSEIETVSGNKLAFRSASEIGFNSNYVASGEGGLVNLYINSKKRTKSSNSGTTTTNYWSRSPRINDSKSFVYVLSTGEAINPNSASNGANIAPFGCI